MSFFQCTVPVCHSHSYFWYPHFSTYVLCFMPYPFCVFLSGLQHFLLDGKTVLECIRALERICKHRPGASLLLLDNGNSGLNALLSAMTLHNNFGTLRIAALSVLLVIVQDSADHPPSRFVLHVRENVYNCCMLYIEVIMRKAQHFVMRWCVCSRLCVDVCVLCIYACAR